MGIVKNVLVTGASGYLGAKISLHLKKLGYHVYALCRSIPGNIHSVFKGIEIINGDITVPETLDHLLSKPVNSIIHTVSLDHKLSETASVDEVNKINVLPTWQLLDAFSKRKLEKFIFLSTMQVLGKLPLQSISETSVKNPLNLYGLTHSIGEDLINFYNQTSDVYCTSLRLSNGYGSPVFEKNNCWWLVVNDLCRSAYYNKKIVLNSDGTPTRDFIHISDIAGAVGFILDQKNLTDPLFHVSSGVTKSLLEIAHLVRKEYENRYHTSIPVYHSGSVLSEFIPKAAPPYKIVNKKLLNLGFGPTISLEEGIEELFGYFENLKIS